uniref:TsaA-like domain-containing protein n=1 Tax=Calcidiscus leptoporus TaxID=127549 RepID=A0A7S0JHN4_9EUKA
MCGLEQFSHVWLIYHFHENTNAVKQQQQQHVKAKVHPPALGGKSIGLFATRTPHRPNPIGLSVARLLEVHSNGTLIVGGADLIDGTPILDIKPYLRHDIQTEASVPEWCEAATAASLIREVRWTAAAEASLLSALPSLRFYSQFSDVRKAIQQVLCLDIRSVHQGRGNAADGQRFVVRFDKLELVFHTYEAHVEVERCDLY